jgi:hypothetical protein
VDELIEQFTVSGGGEDHHARELKTLAGLAPTPPPPVVKGIETREIAVAGDESDVEALLAMGTEPQRPAAPETRPSPGTVPEPRTEARRGRPQEDERQLPTQISQRKRARQALPSGPRKKDKGKGGSGLLFAAAGLSVLAAGALAAWQLRPGAAANRAPQHAASAASIAPPAASICKGMLVVTDVPPHAEVLLRKGQAPIDVERMPVGTRLEFVATAEGFAPKRVVVPAGARWDQGPDGKPRYEAGVQLDKSKARAGAHDPWPAGEPGSEVGGQGPPGTVHVVATPHGAEVWMLAGIGPEAHIDLHCDEDVDVLVAGPTTYRKRLHVSARDFAPDDTVSATAKGPTRVAHVSAK